MQKNRRSWFENKKCNICGKQGTTFRLIHDKQGILCDNPKCELISRIRTGFFGGINIKGDK